MNIWYNGTAPTLDQLAQHSRFMLTHLDIKILRIHDNGLDGSMPVDDRTKQPFGLLHGGASCVLAESLGSIASNLVINSEKFAAVGLSITANHIRSVRSGLVTGRATPIHLGKSTHVWDIAIVDDSDRLICTSRLTTAVIEKKL